MEILKYTLLLIAFVCLIFIWFFIVCNKFKALVIRINETQSKIESSLRKRYDLLNKSIAIISAYESAPENVLNEIVEMKSKKLNNFDFDKQIVLGIKTFYSFSELIEDLNSNAEYKKIAKELEKSEIELSAYKKYYNEIATLYNKKVKKITTRLVALMGKFKSVSYFE
jgi:LemA protein